VGSTPQHYESETDSTFTFTLEPKVAFHAFLKPAADFGKSEKKKYLAVDNEQAQQ